MQHEPGMCAALTDAAVGHDLGVGAAGGAPYTFRSSSTVRKDPVSGSTAVDHGTFAAPGMWARTWAFSWGRCAGAEASPLNSAGDRTSISARPCGGRDARVVGDPLGVHQRTERLL
ncbi:hypothetical protein BH23ACT10_BH23ACT10_13780 [soil metagenome]